MKYYLYSLVAFFCLACSGGFESHPEMPEASGVMQELNGIRFGFNPTRVEIQRNQSQLTITGACDVGDHPNHFVYWEYMAGSLRSGIANNPCRDGALSFTVNLAGETLKVGETQFKGQIYAVSDAGQQVNGPTAYLAIQFQEPATATPVPTPGPTPGPISGNFCADAWVREYCRQGVPPNRLDIVHQVASRFPDKLSRCDRKNNEFVKEVVRELRKTDERWGFNWVRGSEGDWNGDVIGYYHGPGNPTENSQAVTIIDVVSSCGEGNYPVWGVEHHQGSCCEPQGVKWTLQPLNLGP